MTSNGAQPGASEVLLEQLSNAHGVSGYEDDVRALIRTRVAGLNPESVTVDPLGNLICRWPSEKPGATKVMLDAHMDEIGMVISYIETDGFLRFVLIGGWDERVLPAHLVQVRTYDGKLIEGVIGTPPPHILRAEEKNKPFAVDQLFIDVGAKSRDEVQALGIAVGDSAVPCYPFRRLLNDGVCGKALDNRAGCTVLLRTLEELKQADEWPADIDLTAVFSTFEEIGGRGAQVAAYEIIPDIALVFEGTVAADSPGVPASRNPSSQGRGPAITLMDRTAHLPRRLVAHLQAEASAAGIPCQIKTPIFGGTNAARIHMVRSGVPTGVISVPCRYIHSPHSILRLSDLEATVTLARRFILSAHRYLNPPA